MHFSNLTSDASKSSRREIFAATAVTGTAAVRTILRTRRHLSGTNQHFETRSWCLLSALVSL